MTARHKSKKAASQAVESAMQRAMRIGDSQNGATLRTRVVKSKNKYQRNLKHKTSFASAEDVFYAVSPPHSIHSPCTFPRPQSKISHANATTPPKQKALHVFPHRAFKRTYKLKDVAIQGKTIYLSTFLLRSSFLHFSFHAAGTQSQTFHE